MILFSGDFESTTFANWSCARTPAPPLFSTLLFSSKCNVVSDRHKNIQILPRFTIFPVLCQPPIVQLPDSVILNTALGYACLRVHFLNYCRMAEHKDSKVTPPSEFDVPASLPFISRRSPFLCTNGVCCTAQPLASSIGLRILQSGFYFGLLFVVVLILCGRWQRR